MVMIMIMVMVVVVLVLLGLGVQLCQHLQPHPQGLDLVPEFQEALVDFAFQMGLYPLLCIVDGLNRPTNFADLIQEESTFCCFWTLLVVSFMD